MAIAAWSAMATRLVRNVSHVPEATWAGRVLASGMITAADVREVAMSLPRTSEHLIRDYVKFRVGQIVYASVSPDETMIGFGFPKEEREAMIASRPDVFVMPRLSDQRYQWIVARMAALGKDEMTELITDA